MTRDPALVVLHQGALDEIDRIGERAGGVVTRAVACIVADTGVAGVDLSHAQVQIRRGRPARPLPARIVQLPLAMQGARRARRHDAFLRQTVRLYAIAAPLSLRQDTRARPAR